MKKVKTYKGYVIAQEKETGRYFIYSKDEWAYGQGFRYEEWTTDSIQEAIDWIG